MSDENVSDREDLDGLKNLGPTSRAWLAEIGITTRSRLAEIGSVGACLLLRERGRKVSLNLVYAIEGALLDIHWTDQPRELRERLRTRIAEEVAPQNR